MPLSEDGKARRFANYESLGLDRVKHDLLNGGHRLVGGSPAVREAAWEWVRLKEAEAAKATAEAKEILSLKPNLWGISIDIKRLWRMLKRNLGNSK